jgi:hypothetical protein
VANENLESISSQQCPDPEARKWRTSNHKHWQALYAFQGVPFELGHQLSSLVHSPFEKNGCPHLISWLIRKENCSFQMICNLHLPAGCQNEKLNKIFRITRKQTPQNSKPRIFTQLASVPSWLKPWPWSEVKSHLITKAAPNKVAVLEHLCTESLTAPCSRQAHIFYTSFAN